MNDERKRIVRVPRWQFTALVLLELGLVAGIVTLTVYANAPGWLLLYPVLVIALLAVSGLIVIAVLRRL